MTQTTKWSSGRKRNSSRKPKDWIDGNHALDNAIRDFLKEHVYRLDEIAQTRLNACCKLVVAAYKMRLGELACQTSEKPSLKCPPGRQQSRTRFVPEAAPVTDYGLVKKKPEN